MRANLLFLRRIADSCCPARSDNDEWNWERRVKAHAFHIVLQLFTISAIVIELTKEVPECCGK